MYFGLFLLLAVIGLTKSNHAHSTNN